MRETPKLTAQLKSTRVLPFWHSFGNAFLFAKSGMSAADQLLISVTGPSESC